MWIEEISVRAEVGPWLLSSVGKGINCKGRSRIVVDGVLDGGGALLQQMHGSMMINFSLANQKAGNAGLGKLGPCHLCQQLGREQWAFYYYDVTLAL